MSVIDPTRENSHVTAAISSAEWGTKSSTKIDKATHTQDYLQYIRYSISRIICMDSIIVPAPVIVESDIRLVNKSTPLLGFHTRSSTAEQLNGLAELQPSLCSTVNVKILSDSMVELQQSKTFTPILSRVVKKNQGS